MNAESLVLRIGGFRRRLPHPKPLSGASAPERFAAVSPFYLPAAVCAAGSFSVKTRRRAAGGEACLRGRFFRKKNLPFRGGFRYALMLTPYSDVLPTLPVPPTALWEACRRIFCSVL